MPVLAALAFPRRCAGPGVPRRRRHFLRHRDRQPRRGGQLGRRARAAERPAGGGEEHAADGRATCGPMPATPGRGRGPGRPCGHSPGPCRRFPQGRRPTPICARAWQSLGAAQQLANAAGLLQAAGAGTTMPVFGQAQPRNLDLYAGLAQAANSSGQMRRADRRRAGGAGRPWPRNSRRPGSSSGWPRPSRKSRRSSPRSASSSRRTR